MKILLLHNFYQRPGGEDVVFANEKAVLESRGHDVATLTVVNEGIDNPYKKLKTALSATWSRHGYEIVKNAIKEHQPDVMHVHNFFPVLSPSVFDSATETATPTVMTLHNFRITCSSPYLFRDNMICEKCVDGSAFWGVWHRCYRRSLVGSAAVSWMVDFHRRRGTWNRINRLIVLSHFAKSVFKRAGVNGDAIVVKPNCIPDAFPHMDRHPAKPRAGALFVGRLSEEKGVEFLIRAWHGIDLPLTIVGNGPLMRDCRALAPPNVHFAGWQSREQILSMMERSLFLVLPSLWYEMFGLVVLEAFSAGLPVVASRLGAMPELVTTGNAGVLFTPGDEADFRATVNGVLKDPQRCDQWGRNARAHFVKKFTAELNGPMLEEIYRGAMQNVSKIVPADDIMR